MLRAFLFTALGVSALLAQAPMIQSVVNGYSGEDRLAAGLFAKIHYGPAAASDAQHAASNIAFGRETVFVKAGTFSVPVVAVTVDEKANGAASVVLPEGLAVGPTTLTLTNSRGSSPPFTVWLNAYAPGIRPPWTFCRDGAQIAVLNAVGLGQTTPPLPSGFLAPGEHYVTRTQLVVTAGGVEAEVLASEGYPPLREYSVLFRVPSELAEGIHDVSLSVAGVASNLVQVVAGVQHRIAGQENSVGAPAQLRTAPDAIMTAASCGGLFEEADAAGDWTAPRLTVGGISVKVRDAAGSERDAPILSVSARKVQYVVPAGTSNGRVTASVLVGGRVVSSSPLEIEQVEPRLFCSSFAPCGWTPAPAGYVVRVRDGETRAEPIPEWQSPGPPVVDLGPPTDQVWLVLFATGLRHRSSLEQVAVTGCPGARVEYAGPSPEVTGVDQVNIRMGRWPRGSTGQEDGARLTLMVDGKASNDVILGFTQQDEGGGR